ncbi:response regulator [Gynuella sunshinyii]|uniref:Response regulator consisting of a CheY-like receiver domain and a winged-helix DNA-binding domain n=1 Tax=Gynuella sunshinyii YC6258 TaxID=1445510 RepID=A0A0C5VSQ3_9GAMM|nr:response regulator [Gynuella sunshinyii]AJQ97226.1 response regulator consisting of a CheY-like receiver domain and a winged-helix DNA-binding domain [Gynuella sunshinyii YC6258]
MAHTILLVEDERDIAEVTLVYLQAQGYETQWLNEGLGVVDWVQSHSPSLVILDLMLPGKDGLTICQEIRQFSDVPIIMTTAKVQEIDRLLGLDAGADDYVCKPFSTKELIARVNAAIRRLDRRVIQTAPALQLIEGSYAVVYQNTRVDLTQIEFNLFRLLYSHPGRIYARAQILDLVYQDFRDVSDRTIDSHIRNLRKKLTQLNLPSEPIRSVYGAGYVYEAL